MCWGKSLAIQLWRSLGNLLLSIVSETFNDVDFYGAVPVRYGSILPPLAPSEPDIPHTGILR